MSEIEPFSGGVGRDQGRLLPLKRQAWPREWAELAWQIMPPLNGQKKIC
jgi:hypothetical protein